MNQDLNWDDLLERASEPYRVAGRFAYHFARGKLGRDPVFKAMVQEGWLRLPMGRGLDLLDIGSGQSLIASLLHAQGDSPLRSYTGIDLMARDVKRAQTSLRHVLPAPTLLCADMREAQFPAVDLVVILDVLHYVDHQAQIDVLRRVDGALRPGGRLLLRVGDQEQASGYAASQWVDRIVTAVRGHHIAPTWGRPLSAWVDLLTTLGFGVKCVPMSQGTPFANVLLLADR